MYSDKSQKDKAESILMNLPLNMDMSFLNSLRHKAYQSLSCTTALLSNNQLAALNIIISNMPVI